jgi:two-component system osmolarity sensor histidine kinase EnvZ
MNFDWLKRYMPRGLYGRAALILVLPIVTLQIVVSVVFIQRHFEDVTLQMTRALSLDLRFLLSEVETSDSQLEATVRIARLSDPLQLRVDLPAADFPGVDRRAFYDLSGRVVIEVLRQRLPGVIAVDLERNQRVVNLWLKTKYGAMKVAVSRQRVSASNPHQFLVLMVFVGLVMTLVAYSFLRNQLRPIKRLARAAEAFGKGRVEPYKPSGATEVRAAGNAFLDMRARIERMIEQRTMMLSGVSHDLRTPLTRLKLALSMMEDSPEKQELARDVAEMERLLEEFLAYARDDAMDELQETDPAALVRAVVGKTARAGGAVELGEVQGEGMAMMRPVAVSRALGNLIDNALRYGKRAEVSLFITERALRIVVEDDGPGIAEELREEALKPFSRLDAARNQDRGSGVGLGLSIAQDIARRHGGTLQLRDSARLGGLRAEIVLPR